MVKLTKLPVTILEPKLFKENALNLEEGLQLVKIGCFRIHISTAEYKALTEVQNDEVNLKPSVHLMVMIAAVAQKSVQPS